MTRLLRFLVETVKRSILEMEVRKGIKYDLLVVNTFHKRFRDNL